MKRCDGIDRREFLRVGSLPALGLGLTSVLPNKSFASRHGNSSRINNCILVWLDGGPSHLDTFDLKPDAPVEVRGKFKPISTNVSGIRICEHFEKLSKKIDKTCIIRSMTSDLGVHGLGSQYLLTGYKPTPALSYPSYGSVVAHCNDKPGVLPSYIALRNNGRLQAGNSIGAGYLPASSQPFILEGDPGKPDFRVRDLRMRPGFTDDSILRRRAFLTDLDRLSQKVEENAIKNERDSRFEQAYRLIFSEQAKAAFDLSKEKHQLRDKYGKRYNRWTQIGQSCLLARRLIEAGCRFVTVTDSGWDMHGDIHGAMERKLPALDAAVATLLDDLESSGLIDETLVVMLGEFGRTPRLNGAAGRDHWPRAFSVMLAGAGVKTGQVVGETDPRGFVPVDRPVSPAELARTIYTLLGIDPQTLFYTSDQRPVLVSPDCDIVSQCIA